MFVLRMDDGFEMFPSIKRYIPKNGIEPVYFLLQAPDTNCNILCRELEPSENVSDFGKVCFFREVGSKDEFKPCLTICCVKSDNEADAIVTSYESAFARLEVLDMEKSCPSD